MKSAPNVDHGSRCGKKSCTDEDIVDWTDSTATYPGRHINEADAISSHESWAHDIGDVDERWALYLSGVPGKFQLHKKLQETLFIGYLQFPPST